MKIVVTPGQCQGHARCYALAPDFFDLDDEGYVAFSEKPLGSDDDVKRIRRAVNACPERALLFAEKE